MLKHPDDLQDRDILRNLDAYLGAGFQQDGFVVKRRSGETPMAFIGRVKGEYRAWYDSQKAQEARKARAAQVGDQAPGQGSPIIVTATRGGVQGPEISLADAIEAQVTRLREQQRASVERNRQLAQDLDDAQKNLFKITKELAQAEKFLKELKESVSTCNDASEFAVETQDFDMLAELKERVGEKLLKEIQEGASTPKDASEMGGDLHPKVGQRKPRRSRRVGSAGSPPGGEPVSEGRDAEDPTGAGEDAV